MSQMSGGFTLPGEAGYESLTLKMAEKWGADVIRDSDGTELSHEILNSGYGIYSTICIIRDHNEWAKKNKDKLQQTFLITNPILATEIKTDIVIMADFFMEQFAVNDSIDAMRYWQVYDRTLELEISNDNWSFNSKSGIVTVRNTIPYHTYTVSFLAYRIWEEISMYNHVTNQWEKEHLMQIDPRHPEAQEFMKAWLENWCIEHPHTTVVRFTSLFYNFAWIWGSDERNRNLFSDWGSYDFTVSPLALDQFKEKYGYTIRAEDFVNQGKFQVTHMPATTHKKEWMEFTHEFVVAFGKKLVDITHHYGKKAYVFYDDSWVGMEPYGEHFSDFGFDGLIKCVFSGFEVRLCAGVSLPTHEIRLHPYLFPVGLGGLPTFTQGGNPTRDAKQYWISVRRALLRAPIQRIGLGGYLHLTENFPDFQDYIEEISDEFRMIQKYLECGMPYTQKPKVAVLHYWGKLRSWSLSGHFHETFMHDLIHINEALSGLPLDVDFIGFDEVKNGDLAQYDVVINAGKSGSAWSGGEEWKDNSVIERLNEWVYKGGVFIGIDEPSATEGYHRFFRMAEVLGVDKDTGARVCHGKWDFMVNTILNENLIPEDAYVLEREGIYLTDKETVVLAAHGKCPDCTLHKFGEGYGIYLSGFQYSTVNARMLLNLILYTCGEKNAYYLTDNPNTECAFYPDANKLVVINNTDRMQNTGVNTKNGIVTFNLEPYGHCEIVLSM